MIAQALGEYGGITGGMMQSLIEGLQIIEDHLRNPDGATILGAAVVVFVLWFLFIRRR